MNSMDGVGRLKIALSAGAATAGYLLVSPRFAAGVVAGALLETINFRHLLRSGKAFFAGRVQSWGGGFALRFLFLGAGMAAALHVGAHPIGLVLGLSIILPALIIEAYRHPPEANPAAPALPPDDPSWDSWDPWFARERDQDGDVK